jgi:drug/metabolite transporter (DMT)-like permease
MTHLGEIAALGTAACWVVSALSFEAAGERIGSLALNVHRLFLAAVFLTVFSTITRGPGSAIPLDATAYEWGWLGASSIVGFVIGDFLLFAAFVELGPRLSSLIMASAPVWATAIGWVGLKETLDSTQSLGMGLVVAGIAWAVSERPRGVAKPVTARGVALAIGGAFGQGAGLVLSKKGIERGYDVIAATQLRVFVAVLGFALVVTATRRWGPTLRALTDRRAMRFTIIGAVFGPCLGVALSLLAVRDTQAGVAAALMATTPILLIPVVALRGERIGVGGLLGTLAAVGGAALLFQ